MGGRKGREEQWIRGAVGDYVQRVWAHIDVGTQEFKENSFARRRRVLASNAYQLHSDVAYWNENKNTGSPIQILFDFSDYIAAKEAVIAFVPQDYEEKQDAAPDIH